MENLKKRIFFYNGSLRMGGIERVLVEVLQNLDYTKYEIDLVIEDGIRSLNVFEKDIPKNIKLFYLKPEEIMQKTIFFREKRKNNIIYRGIYQLMMEYEKYLKKKNLKKIIKDKKYDTTIDFDMGLSKYIDLVDSDKKIAWVHSNIESWYKKKNRIERLGKRLDKYDTVVTICDEMRENTKKLYPFLKEKLMRIYNPFNFERVRRLSEENIEDSLIEYKNNRYYISVMRLTTDSKDFDTLVKAFDIAKKQGLEEKLYILGDGPDREEVKNIIKNYGMENEIYLLGSIKNPYPWIKGSEALVHSSKYEGLPTVLVEGLILGKNVISSICSTGPKEILENGRLGKLYAVGDYKELAKILLENKKYKFCIKDEDIEKYSIKSVIKEYEKIM